MHIRILVLHLALHHGNITTVNTALISPAILLLPQVSSCERLHRTEHLGALMYLASICEWLAVRSFHEAVLLEIERGQLNWGDSFLHLENLTLASSHRKVKDQTKCPAPQTSTII